MSEILFKIHGREYKVTVDEEFATFLKKAIINDFKSKNLSSREELINAYVKAQHQIFLHEQHINQIIAKLTLDN